MAFSLTGPRLREALDEETGIRIKTLGARGPEIENQTWQVSFGDLCFEFSTRVGDEDDNVGGKRRVRISPSLALIDYLNSGPGISSERKAHADRMVEGIAFLTPVVHFRLAIFFSKGVALAARRVGDRVLFDTIDAPGLWDAERVAN